MNLYLKKFIDKKFKKSKSALDLGAGEFFDVVYLKYLGWKVKGVDKKTGTDLEKPHLFRQRPFDLVYSNNVYHFIKNKKIFIKTCCENLKDGGWLFLHTFDKDDPSFKKYGQTSKELIKLLDDRFKNIKITKFKYYYDNDLGHKHWHTILEVTAQKK